MLDNVLYSLLNCKNNTATIHHYPCKKIAKRVAGNFTGQFSGAADTENSPTSVGYFFPMSYPLIHVLYWKMCLFWHFGYGAVRKYYKCKYFIHLFQFGRYYTTDLTFVPNFTQIFAMLRSLCRAKKVREMLWRSTYGGLPSNCTSAF